MSTSATPPVGGRDEIRRTLGKGSFGHTSLARERSSDRSVAIKVLDAKSAHDAKAYELFRREAEVLRALRHHGIPEVYETLQDSWNGAPATFLVMEYIELLGILDYLHGRVPPILHRDIKPSNIIVRPNGFAALADFGSEPRLSAVTARLLKPSPAERYPRRTRKRRMKRFFREGTPAVAQIIKMEMQESSFEEKVTRVGYEFEADGTLHRDSDTVLPVVIDRWQVGDRIPILYIAGRAYDGVIVATE